MKTPTIAILFPKVTNQNQARTKSPTSEILVVFNAFPNP